MGLLKRTFTKKQKDDETKEDEKKEKVSDVVVGKKGKRGFSIEAGNIILRPLVSEKASILSSLSKYVFVVHENSTRLQVRSSIRSMYGVTPVSVRIQNQKGKSVHVGRRQGNRKNWKKAIVTLPKGKTINVYEGV
ncbi:TPA: 50S ribosomal protein L23 [Candidatus Uhrbacteria bacterium]|uniref:Large ribosomal subunit protein uL23 n=2 Tax=Candidatus Uhriibacteriota TaxID=1752732 RepID=A0A0G1T727_9BACT|nr:MAG: 50S ribosomal protein L23 [Candidatus Uhrbacteria bacterium GW2011_GWF2_46_218]KKU41185.1 MAG: 50S ribosomal protein L23 [Candidatus Uhrbacteria bacterium GW2011_GWE2_46_68]HBK34032.1 50S ribosomal protein L23 [Candidatus Uhrbacteria bacterium]HCB18890.1 50S ribosomal protein L23 [Candidatus Uhrbacteria bacterium]